MKVYIVALMDGWGMNIQQILNVYISEAKAQQEVNKHKNEVHMKIYEHEIEG